MQRGLTDITIVLDRSGSMHVRRDDTIGGFAHFLDQQRKADGKATISLLQFNEYLHWHMVPTPLEQVEPLQEWDYRPLGGTALLDAMGTAITHTGRRLAGTPEALRPEKVIILTISDGAENSSSTFTKAAVGQLIKMQVEQYNWLFMFTGTNFDAISEGASLGISVSNSMNFTSQQGGMRKAMEYAAIGTMRARSANVSVNEMSKSAAYTAEERADALTPDVK